MFKIYKIMNFFDYDFCNQVLADSISYIEAGTDI